MKLTTLILTLINATQVYRTISGVNNNPLKPLLGSSGESFIRIIPHRYTDSTGMPTGTNRPSARVISNIVFNSGRGLLTKQANNGLSALFPYWGQFVTHDIILSSENSTETVNTIPIPLCDIDFDYNCMGNLTIPFTRLERKNAILTDPRPMINHLSSFLDASNVYGTDESRCNQLRLFNGGRLLTSDDRLLPLNTNTIPMNGNLGTSAFLTGDVRGNENPVLQSLHTLLVREHNRRALELEQSNPMWDDEIIFQESRKWVISVYQKITITEYVPLLTGTPLPPYSGYNVTVNPSIDTFFMGAAFRYGHSAIPQFILRLDEFGLEDKNGHIPLRQALFNPEFVKQSGIDSILRGIVSIQEQKVDSTMIDDLRLFMTRPVFDLAARNIHRGRDLGLPSYNDARVLFGLSRVSSWSMITSDVGVQERLRIAYNDDIDSVDAFVGGLSEDHVVGSTLGALFRASVMEQFKRLRDGDRYWYEQPGILSAEERVKIGSMNVQKLIELNSGVKFKSSPFGVQTFGVSNGTESAGSVKKSRVLSGDFKLSWSVSASEITFELESSNAGYMGIGFGALNMVNVDIHIATFVGGEGKVLDTYSKTNMPEEDAKSGGSDDITLVSVVDKAQGGGKSKFVWKRKLVTGDANDYKFVDGTVTNIIWALGNSYSLDYHGIASRGSIPSVDFFAKVASADSTNPTTTSASQVLYLYKSLHGLLMFLSFAILQPLGIYMIKYFKSSWVSAHEHLMLVAASNIIVVAIIAILSAEKNLASAHQIIGITLASIMLVLICLGLFITHTANTNVTLKLYVRRLHGWVGYAFTFSGMVNGFLGLRILFYDQLALQVGYVLFCFSYSSLLYFLGRFDIIDKVLKRKVNGFAMFSSHVPTFSEEEFVRRVDSNQHWMVIKDMIVNVANIGPSHPGGLEPVRLGVGTDATGLFYGEEKLGHYPKVVHSRFALWQVTENLVGHLRRESGVVPEVGGGGGDAGGVGDVSEKRVSVGGGRKPLLPCMYQQVSLLEKVNICSDANGKHNTWKYVFKLPFAGVLQFIPGEHVIIASIVGDRVVCRSYTPINLTEENEITLIVRDVANGIMTKELLKLTINDFILMRGPVPSAIPLLNENSTNGCWKQLGLIAGGTGLAPMILLIKYHLVHGQKVNGEWNTRVSLLYYDHDEAALIYRDELLELARKSNGLLTVHFGLTSAPSNFNGYSGYISAQAIQQTMPPPPHQTRKSIDSNFISMNRPSGSNKQLVAGFKKLTQRYLMDDGIRRKIDPTTGVSGMVIGEKGGNVFLNGGGGGGGKVESDTMRVMVSGPGGLIKATAELLVGLEYPVSCIVECP